MYDLRVQNIEFLSHLDNVDRSSLDDVRLSLDYKSREFHEKLANAICRPTIPSSSVRCTSKE